MIKANVRLAVMSKFNFPGMKPTPLLHLQPPSQIPLNQEKPYPYSLSVNRRAIENDFNSGGDSFDLTEGSKGSDTSTFKRRIKVSITGVNQTLISSFLKRFSGGGVSNLVPSWIFHHIENSGQHH